MKTILAAACAAVLIAAAPARAQGPTGRDLVTAALDTVATTLASANFAVSGEPSVVSIATGSFSETRVQVEAGKGYVFMSVCDENCTDIDLLVRTAEGVPVGQDVEEDDTPMVTYVATANATLVVRVSMAACSAATCFAGTGVYTGDPAAFQ